MNTDSANAGRASDRSGDSWWWHDDRHDERLARWEAGHFRKHGWSSGRWWTGAILVLLGSALLLQNLGISVSGHWWALLLLVPALGSFEAAARPWHDPEHSSSSVTGPLIAGLVFTFLTAMLLFDLDWGLLWPLVLVILGIGGLLGGIWPGPGRE